MKCTFNFLKSNPNSSFACFLKDILLLILPAVLIFSGCSSLRPNPGTDRPSASVLIGESTADLKTGDLITFGNCEQDNDPDNGPEPIEWQILTVENGRALVISKYALDVKPYNETAIHAAWQISTIRKWLNGEFFNSAFSEEERSVIAEVKNKNPKNPSSGKWGGLSTRDRIFLLSIDEADRFFPDDNTRQCRATAYARANGAHVDEAGYSWWWLRSPGDLRQTASIVLSLGYVSHPGFGISDPFEVVRPAFWLEL